MKTSRLFFAIISILFLPLFFCSGQIKIINNIHYPASTVFHNADSALAKTSAPSSSDLSDPKIIKPDFIVNSFGGDYGAEQRRPVIAIDSSGNYAAAWLDFRSGNKEIYAQFFDNHDNPIGSNIRVSDNASGWNMDPAIAVNKKGDFIIAWAQDWNLLLAQRFTKNGQKTGGNLKLNSRSGTNISQPSLAVADDGRFLVYWDIEDYSRGRSLCTRMFDPSGNAFAEEISIGDQPNTPISSSGWGNRAAVDANNNFAVVWSQYINNVSKIILQRIDPDGKKIGNNVIISSLRDSTTLPLFPSVSATEDGIYLVAWEVNPVFGSSDGGVCARIFNYKGNFVSDQLSLYKTPFGWMPCSVSSDRHNTFFVAWPGDTSVHCQKILSDGKFLGKTELLKFNSDFTVGSPAPKISDLVNGQLYLAFDYSRFNDLNIYLQKFNAGLSPSGSLNKINDDFGSSWQTKPLVCYNDLGGYIILWEDRRNGRYDLYGQVFDKDNNPLGNDFQLNDASKGSWYLKDKSVKALSDGSFAVAFSGSSDYNLSDIYLRLISPDGQKTGNAVTVYKSSDYYNDYKLAMNLDKQDNILLAWYSNDYTYSRAFLKQYSKVLAPITPVSNFINYAYTDNLRKSSLSLSVNKDLNVFAVWNYYDAGKSTYSKKITGEIFSNRGVSLSGEMTLDSVSRQDGSIHYLTASLGGFSEKDYALAWYDGAYLHIKRNYFVGSQVSYSDSLGMPLAFPPQIISFSNRKLLITYLSGFYPFPAITGFYFNDNHHEKLSFPVYQFDSSSQADNESHYNNSSALVDNKLVFAYESCRNGLTGFDIWAKALQIGNINSKPEWFLKPVNNDVLYPNTPNPFNSTTKISYQIYSYHKVRLAIYDILGREVKVIFDGYQEKGFYEFNFDGSGLPSGIYLCRLETFNTFVNKMLMIK